MLQQCKPNVAKRFIANMFSTNEIANQADKAVLLENAKLENERFAGLKTSESIEIKNGVEQTIISTTIGPDTYEKAFTKKGASRYFKNSKPITDITYFFETNRRFEDVLKYENEVKKIKKYQPEKNLLK